MANIPDILKKAAARAAELGLPYAGALMPAEAYELMQHGGARLVDVRTRAEWDYVGRVPGSILVEWQTWPHSQPNPAFLEQLREQVPTDTPVMFLCRSGARSNAAAALAARSGYERSYNVLEGFEGDKDAQGHRSSVGGWRFAGLPWVQG
jgi:rhodanese-related sulfurtransferase